MGPLTFFAMSLGVVYLVQLAVPDPDPSPILLFTPPETARCNAFFASDVYEAMEPLLAPLLTIPGAFLAWLLMGRSRCRFSRVFNAGLYLGGVWNILAVFGLFLSLLLLMYLPGAFIGGVGLFMIVAAVLLTVAMGVNVTRGLSAVARIRYAPAFFLGFLLPTLVIVLVDEALLWQFCRSGIFGFFDSTRIWGPISL